MRKEKHSNPLIPPEAILKLQRKYNPEISHDLAERLLEGVTNTEAESWFKHPCTQSLLAGLDGDLAGTVAVWLGGGYSSEESSDGTAQKQAKARGMAQAIQDMLDRIDDIKALKEDTE
jgi:hypothetical protein